MNIRYLEVLEAIEGTGTFTGAARKLHLTQSAVSHAIAELERQAGTALFDRLPRGVSLTPCGASLLEEGRGILAASRSLDKRIGRLEESTPVSLVSSITIASFVLPPILGRLKAEYPELKVRVRVESADSAMGILQRGEADLAFWEGVEPQGVFRTVLLGTYRLCLVCAPAFPLKEDVLTPRRLCGLPLLLREPGSAIRDTLDSALKLAGQKAHPAWESVNSLALMKAAEAGLGMAVLPENLLKEPLSRGSLRILKLDGMELENKMLAVLHRDKYITRPLKMLLDAIGSTLNFGENYL